jgi:L-asparaginase II
MQTAIERKDTGQALALAKTGIVGIPLNYRLAPNEVVELMRAMNGRVAIKTGAEAVFVAIIPERRMGIALKITDGGTRGAEGAITALLVKLGVLDADHPAAKKRLDAIQKNWRGTETGIVQRASGFCPA